jgi:hypothetical protein
LALLRASQLSLTPSYLMFTSMMPLKCLLKQYRLWAVEQIYLGVRLSPKGRLHEQCMVTRQPHYRHLHFFLWPSTLATWLNLATCMATSGLPRLLVTSLMPLPLDSGMVKHLIGQAAPKTVLPCNILNLLEMSARHSHPTCQTTYRSL